MPGTVVWFGHDLRLSDHAALDFAAATEGPVIPLFVWAPDEYGDWAPGGAHRSWLRESLSALDASLREKGSRLIVRQGSSLDALRDVLEASGADRVVWLTRFEPALRERDQDVREALEEDGITCTQFAGRLLHEPEEIRTGSGGPYHVYTPFWKKFQKQVDVPEPLATPRLGEPKAPEAWPESTDLDALGLSAEQQDGVDWSEAMQAFWTPGEDGARQRLDRFLEVAEHYDDDRNRPDLRHTSELSPHLHWGEISPRQVWHAVQSWVSNGTTRDAADVYLSEIAWREFSYHILHAYPDSPTVPLKDKFADFRWDEAPEALRAWQRGETGFPIVDAGMRQLYALGWMHNRVRMIVGSFLTKDLFVDWREGERWFWDCLCGADLANNSMGWQWVAGCGADAQPFFRIFNPVSQGEKHDPEGDYVREWVPELKDLPKKWIHKPWEAPVDVLEAAGVTLGETYPEPIVDHSTQRDEAMERYNEIR
ncbi:MAG: deoxyribodipyrimidine photo-lyase [Bacteroidota bacterium]